MKPRPVKIMEQGDSWTVEYTDRKPRQRHFAACFHKSMRTRAKVAEWVNLNPKLILVP